MSAMTRSSVGFGVVAVAVALLACKKKDEKDPSSEPLPEVPAAPETEPTPSPPDTASDPAAPAPKGAVKGTAPAPKPVAATPAKKPPTTPTASAPTTAPSAPAPLPKPAQPSRAECVAACASAEKSSLGACTGPLADTCKANVALAAQACRNTCPKE